MYVYRLLLLNKTCLSLFMTSVVIHVSQDFSVVLPSTAVVHTTITMFQGLLWTMPVWGCGGATMVESTR